MKGPKKQRQESEISVSGVDLGQLERLLSFMSQHGLEEFEYAHGDLRIRLKKAGTPASVPPQRALPEPAPAPVPHETKEPEPAEEKHLIKSPIVGTYYAGPNPESGPFVRVGDMVEAGQTVCIIEAMKLMNEIEADISGQVTQVLVENGQPVEYGEPLFALRPPGKKS
jgi:acetyl-CoA carboxylase biotin carboxyl carrier protein